MRTRVSLVMVFCCGVLLAAGCAKKEVVKPEAPPAPIAQPKPTEPPSPAKQPAKEEAVPDRTVQEAKIPEETGREAGDKAAQAEVSLERIYFDYDSYVLTQPSRDILYKNADWMLKKNPNAKVQIEGHCDERGSDEYNLALGEKRAKAAMTYLVTLGVPSNRLSIISYGKEKPADQGHDEAAWAKNRRDEFIVQK